MNHERLCTVSMRDPSGHHDDNQFRGRQIGKLCAPSAVVRLGGRRGDPSRVAAKTAGDNFWTVIPVDDRADYSAEFDNPMTSHLLVDCLRYICALERLGQKVEKDPDT